MVLFCYSWLLCHRKLQLNPWNTKALLPPKNTVVSEEHGRVIGNKGFRLLNVAVVQESGEVRKKLQLGEMWRGNLKGAGFTHLNKLLHSKKFCCATLCQDKRQWRHFGQGSHSQCHKTLPEAGNSMGSGKEMGRKGTSNKTSNQVHHWSTKQMLFFYRNSIR